MPKEGVDDILIVTSLAALLITTVIWGRVMYTGMLHGFMGAFGWTIFALDAILSIGILWTLMVAIYDVIKLIITRKEISK